MFSIELKEDLDSLMRGTEQTDSVQSDEEQFVERHPSFLLDKGWITCLQLLAVTWLLDLLHGPSDP